MEREQYNPERSIRMKREMLLAASSLLLLACTPEPSEPVPLDINLQALVDASPQSCAERVYSAGLEFEAGWVQQTNPNGVWRYGWSWSLTSPITLFSRAHVPPVDNGLLHRWDDPSNNVGWVPTVARNSGGDFDNGNVSWSAGALIAHPGDGGSYAHVVFTAPCAGLYSVAGKFYAQQHGINVDVHVLVGARSRFSEKITSLGESRGFALFLPLRAGMTVDFVVGPNGLLELHPGSTGLEAVVARLTGH
jgi:hypothetical protein